MTNEELATLIKAGVNTDSNMLLLHKQTRFFIHSIAKRYRGGAEIEDLEQEGFLALCDAVAGYDAEKECRFLTYAGYWVKLRISNYAYGCNMDMNIDPGQARSIEYKVLRKLRYSRQSRHLRSFLTEYEEIYSKGMVGNGVERFNTTWDSSTERVALRGLP